MRNVRRIARKIMSMTMVKSKDVVDYDSMVKYLLANGVKLLEIEPEHEVKRVMKIHGQSWLGYAEYQINLKFEPAGL